VIGKEFDELRLTGALPTPSAVGLRILEIAQDEDYEQAELEQAIMADAVLSGRILKLANSAAKQGMAGIADIPQAARRLGASTVRSVALGFTLIADNRTDSSLTFDYDLHWARALATAAAANAIAHEVEGIRATDAFTCGLLCEVGTLALACVHPDRYSALIEGAPGARGCQMAELEMKAFDIDHYQVGAAMLADWGLPEEFQLAALLQEREGATFDEPSLAALMRVLRASKSVAEVLAPTPGEGPNSEVRALQRLDGAAEALGLDLERFLEVCDTIDVAWREWGATLGIDICNGTPISGRYSAAGARPGPTPTAPQVVDEARLERAASPPSLESTARERAPDEGPPTRILLIDDDQGMLKLIAHHLRKEGYEVTTSCSSQEGLTVALELQPQLVITDWMMPGMTGLELCRTLRQSKLGRRMYVLVVTSREDDDRVVEAFAAGADDYVVKPFNPRILLARVRAGQRMVRMREHVEAAERTRLRQVAELGILTRKLRAAAMTDPLTGLPNRRYGIKQLKQEWDSSLRTGQPLSVVLADIDHFKDVNDRFGHDVGDAVLREVSMLLRRVGRSGDVLCRLGGEEFLTIDVAATASEAALGAERLRDAVEGLEIQYPGFEGRVTVSLGVAERTADMVNIDDLIKTADDALYAAKARGRNCVVVADPGADGRMRA
jgi:two-component system cell cycle response regulator